MSSKSSKTILCLGFLLATAMAAAAATQEIRLNSVGFLPDMPKRASVQVGGSDAVNNTPIPFHIIRASDNESVFQGMLGNRIINTDTRDTVRIADFTDFSEPGRYYLLIPQLNDLAIVRNSSEFFISDTVFTEPFRAMMLGMYLWRCGSPTGVDATYNGVRYRHGACHRAPAQICHTIPGTPAQNICIGGASGTRDGSGGWHDAGDFNKYVVNSGVTVGLMLKAWEHFSRNINDIDLIAVSNDGNIPAYLAEVKWNLDWVAKMQYGATDGRVSHKLSAINFCGYIMPEDEAELQYFSQWSTAATGAFVGMLAQAARVYRPYDQATADRWLAQARVSYDTLMASPFVRQTQSPFRTGEYGASQTSQDRDQRLWAAAEMWETTGEARFLHDFEMLALPNLYAHLGWADVNVLAGLTYLMSERSGRRQNRVDSLQSALVAAANSVVANTTVHGYGRAFGSNNSSYYWGNHGALTANTYLLNVAYMRTSDERYRSAGHEIISHIFGRNYFARSFVTGVGHNPPVNPHCRRSIASSSVNDTPTPWPGYLVGGPNNQSLTDGSSNVAPSGAAEICGTGNSGTPARCYFDYYPDYARNEIAINWNASMIYALSGFLAEPFETSISGHNVRTARPAIPSPSKRVTRVVRINQNSRMDIPEGSKVYTLDGRLVAHRKTGDVRMPIFRRNGVYIIKVE